MSLIPSIGLTTVEAASRLHVDGYNELPVAEHRGVLRIVFEVVRQPMFALLLSGGVVYLLLGDRTEAILLLAFACLSVSITIVQESRSEKVLEALRNLASPRALVIRDGNRIQIPGREVVRGDVIVITEGDRVAADATLLEANDLMIDESLLTGESVPVGKLAAPNAPADAARAVAGGEDSPYVFAGTLVVRGTAHVLVHATGARSEMGKIGEDLGAIETEQPHLQRQISWLIRDFAIVGAIAGALTILLFGLLRGSWLQAMLGGIALGMSLLPEEFPLVMTVFMAMGAWRISQARVLTRRAAAIERLGATTVLCTDKTGTLTENRMTLVAIRSTDGQWDSTDQASMSERVKSVLESAWLASAREPTDPMDAAVHTIVAAHRVSRLAEISSRPVIRAYGLRPDMFAMANVVGGENGGGDLVYAKGAVEAIAVLSALSPQQVAGIHKRVDELAGRGIRVLGVARSLATGVKSGEPLPDTIRGFAFEYVGLIGFADPLRSNVPAAVAECGSAGIRVVMITGDYPATASAIGRQAGIDASHVLSGDDIEKMTDEELAAHVKNTAIFARIRPNQKLRIVQSLKANGDIVAMTGDGVNDAPAIKAAHIGIAMGGRGTDVAREASSIVLLDDDFGSIVKAIRLGRRIYDNLRKAIEYIVAVHIPIAGLAILPLLLGLPLMLTPIHIAFLEMIIDPACSMVFEAEGEEANVMRRPPRAPKSPLLLPRRIVWALLQGFIALLILAGVLVSASRMGMPEGDMRALVFTSLVLVNIGLIVVNRSFESSLARAILQPNRALLILVGGVFCLLGIALFWPLARELFHFGRLHWDDLAVCAAISVASLIGLEALKSRWFRAVPA